MISPTIPMPMHHVTSDVSQDSQGSGSEKSDSCELISFSSIDYPHRNTVVLIYETNPSLVHEQGPGLYMITFYILLIDLIAEIARFECVDFFTLEPMMSV